VNGGPAGKMPAYRRCRAPFSVQIARDWRFYSLLSLDFT
jgi:hypothetical protein